MSAKTIGHNIKKFIQKNPNKESIKAIKQSETGKNLKKFKSLDDLFKDLGI